MTIPTITSTRRNVPVHDFATASTYLGDRTSRPAGNNTTVHRIDADHIGIRLHSTTILVYTPDGGTHFTADGWHTVTTAARMTAFSDYTVSFRKSGHRIRTRDGVEIPYRDGLALWCR